MDIKWNRNGNWLLTAARDHLMKLFDIRNLKEELQVFKGHKKEATGSFSVLLQNERIDNPFVRPSEMTFGLNLLCVAGYAHMQGLK